MKRHRRGPGRLTAALALGWFAGAWAGPADPPAHLFNGPYAGACLDRVAFPLGGIGAGMLCLEGTGALSHVSIRGQIDLFNEPPVFSALCLLDDAPGANVARVLEGPVPGWKTFGRPGAGNGGAGTTYGLPRFRDAQFVARFPFATVRLADPAVPFDVEITGWSPFTPPDPDPSSLPVAALEYRFSNRSARKRRAVFSLHARNFLGNGPIEGVAGGFILFDPPGTDRRAGFAAFVEGDVATVDHCWFRGGGWDALTIAWHHAGAGVTLDNPPVSGDAPGASLGVPFELGPGEARTVRLLLCWHVPGTALRYGSRGGGPAFRQAPSRGTANRAQQTVSGFLGRGLANSFDPGGDAATGVLVSPEFTVSRRYLHLLVGGGAFQDETCVELVVDGRVVHSVAGQGNERLDWATFDLGKLGGRRARVRIADRRGGGWGHVLADHIVLSDEPIDALRGGSGHAITEDPARVSVLQDFEGADYGGWRVEGTIRAPACACGAGPETYVPWYATRFDDVRSVADHWRERYVEYRRRSETFRDAFHDTTLPPEVVEAVGANLTILKTPTVLRQHDGRLWCWEGCGDAAGCCAGSCTHVWNYAQAICHLFPSLERTLRQTEFGEALDAAGRQAFRANLPVTPGGGAFDAADGQLGGIMKVHREWRIGGDRAWLDAMWPAVRRSLDYAISKWDPRRTGLLEEEHHNTYDINYFGPDGHCGSFYLGALAAAIRMGEELGADVEPYRTLLARGRARMEVELFNGEYFVQKVRREGLARNFTPIIPTRQSAGYRAVVERLNREGPKYQYGSGCLSDGVLGFWMGAVCGLDAPLIDPVKLDSHLRAVHRHNLRRDLSTHANPQRPTYAMGAEGGLLLCTWPRGDRPLLPFIYSDEVWTGIEYQVASHLMMTGHVAEGLEIVRICRNRYDGRRRNPFNEYECGHWYARALSSYALLQGLTGVQYDAPTRTLHVDSRVGDFRSFLATATGFGVVTLKANRAELDVRSGRIAVERIAVAGHGR